MSSRTSGMSSYENARKGYSNAVNKYTGNEGYINSLEQAGEGAQIAANNITAQQKTALRNAGQTNSGAAILAANNMANNYANELSNQQAQVADMGQQAVNARHNNANLNMQGDIARNQQKWSNFGQGLSTAGSLLSTGATLFSDERCKDDKVNLTDASQRLNKYKKSKHLKLGE